MSRMLHISKTYGPMHSCFTRNTPFGKLYVLLTPFWCQRKNSWVTCSLKYEGLHLPIFAANHCLEINSFVFFSGIVSIIHVCLIYLLISCLRYNTVTRWEYTSLFYSNHHHCHSKNCLIYTNYN